jgi:hypothetical protein
MDAAEIPGVPEPNRRVHMIQNVFHPIGDAARDDFPVFNENILMNVAS